MKLLYVMVCPFSRILRKIGFITKEAAMQEAERLLEEKEYDLIARFEIERKEVEYMKQIVEHDRLALHQYALSIGIPAMDRKEMMN